jgi:hypothetical protein
MNHQYDNIFVRFYKTMSMGWNYDKIHENTNEANSYIQLGKHVDELFTKQCQWDEIMINLL